MPLNPATRWAAGVTAHLEAGEDRLFRDLRMAHGLTLPLRVVAVVAVVDIPVVQQDVTTVHRVRPGEAPQSIPEAT